MNKFSFSRGMGARGLYPEGWKEKAQDLSFLLESREGNPQLLTSACPVFHLTPTPHTRLLAGGFKLEQRLGGENKVCPFL